MKGEVMIRLRFDAPPSHTLVEKDTAIAGGDEFEVSDRRAKELLNDPHVSVVLVDETAEAEQAEEADQAEEQTEPASEPEDNDQEVSN